VSFVHDIVFSYQAKEALAVLSLASNTKTTYQPIATSAINVNMRSLLRFASTRA